MNKPEQKPASPPETIWPPPPTAGSPAVQTKSRLEWSRPMLGFGLAINLLACFPAMKLFAHVDGAIFWGEDTNLAPFLVPVSVLAVVIGFPLAAWQIRKRLKQKQFAAWEVTGLLLCVCPYFIGTNAFLVLLRLLNVDVQGHE